MLQRLGRIMRPKDTNVSSTYNAMFYTIVTDETPEMKFFNKRRECLINLGFQYDLKFSCYREETISDLFSKDSENSYVQKANQQYSRIMQIPDEQFFELMKTSAKGEEDSGNMADFFNSPDDFPM